MTPIPLTETQMAELFRLRAENAALKEQVAQLIELNNNLISHRTEQYETITQQADVIEQMREALRHYAYRAGQDWQIAREALALQPSPEILEVRDDKVAEACAKVLDARWDDAAAIEIRAGEWRKYI